MRGTVTVLSLLSVFLASAGGTGARGAADGVAANGRIAFVTGNGIATVNPDGSGVWGLMLTPVDGDPAWSHDGTRLAVAMRWPGAEGITVIAPDARSTRYRVTFSPSDRDPTWSPDGARLAYANGEGRIAIVPAAGGTPTRLTSGPGFDVAPAWSPDGKTIAFRRQIEYRSEVWTVDVATGAETRVVTDARSPSWSPGGDLTYVTYAGAFVRAADGTTRQLLANVSWSSAVAWSPDSTKVLFVRGDSIWLASSSGTELGRLTAGSQPAWQPLPLGPPGCTLWGTPAADILVGTPRDDVICGLGGDDTVLGMNGDDLLRGGSGKDWVAGGLGYDRIYGDGGDDRLDGRDGGGDLVVGGAGDDLAELERADARLGVERRRYRGNLAAWRPVQASGSGHPDPPERAVDGRADDSWNSGGHPPQWIEIDLLAPQAIRRIRLVTGPQAEGVRHLVLGRGPKTRGAYRLLRAVKGPTAVRQEVVLKRKVPWRGIRHLRIETHADRPWAAQWVSWHEIEVYAPPR